MTDKYKRTPEAVAARLLRAWKGRPKELRELLKRAAKEVKK